MTIEEKNYITISFTCPKSIHTKLKTITSASGKTFRNYMIDLFVNDLFERPANKKFLSNLK